MNQNKCHSCSKPAHHLLSVNCGHKVCFTCVKNHKTSKKCSQCLQTTIINTPSKNNRSDSQDQPFRKKSRDLSTSAKKQRQQKSPVGSTIRKVVLTTQDRQRQLLQSTETVYCRQHGQPYSMFYQKSKDVICAVCLYQKGIVSDILPLKNAEQILKKQNKLQRQQSRIALNEIENATKLIKINKQKFRQYLNRGESILQFAFQEIQKQIKQIFENYHIQLQKIIKQKVEELDQINGDLEYLMNTLLEYRQKNKENNTLSENIFVYEYYRIIKNTIKNIDLNYVFYGDKPDPTIFKFNHKAISQTIKNSISMKLDLPLKNNPATRPRKMSVREVQQDQPKHHRQSTKGYSQIKRKKTVQQDQINLYKKLLRSKFKNV